jgi:hypothetical protein
VAGGANARARARLVHQQQRVPHAPGRRRALLYSSVSGPDWRASRHRAGRRLASAGDSIRTCHCLRRVRAGGLAGGRCVRLSVHACIDTGCRQQSAGVVPRECGAACVLDSTRVFWCAPDRATAAQQHSKSVSGPRPGA